jgi:cytidylate kinase
VTVVAIDGPAGAGKSTVARAAAAALGFDFVDTGAMYRAVARAALERGVALDDAAGLERLAAELAPRLEPRGEAMLLDGEPLGDEIRTPAVTAAAVAVAAHPGVRAALMARQRALAARRDVVIEGRDIGSEVVPDAAVKVFLTAAPAERARRRARQDGLGDDPAVLARIQRELEARDAADAGRALSPLRRAEGAVELDTTGLSVAEVVARIRALVEAARG